jgi:16S rRNA (guanine527-N7)-methyltransferase
MTAPMTAPVSESVDRRLVEVRMRAAGIALAERELDGLSAYLDLLLRWNAVYNLTGRLTGAELVDRHAVESLALRACLRGERIADVGSGAGLPGIPLAITEPGRQFTLIEPRAKRVRFLRHVVATLKIGNATVVESRAEDLPADRPFDTVVARAVAPPQELIAITRPLTAIGSILVLLTAAHLREPLIAAAADFVPRPTPAPGAAGLRSTIVVLERA